MNIINNITRYIRAFTLNLAHAANDSHSGGALSMVDILAVLYEKYLDISLIKNKDICRDRVILSKGHCCSSYYATLAKYGILDTDELKDNYAKNGTHYFVHSSHMLSGVELSTGSLGHGLPVACGMALGSKKSNNNFNVYCIVGDGELNEGSNWEAIMFAAHHKLDNLCLIVDKNKMQAMGDTEDILCLDPLSDKFMAFGWNVVDIDGHNIEMIISAFNEFKCCINRPTVIIANTIKGKGVSFMENNLRFHYSAPNEAELKQALEELS